MSEVKDEKFISLLKRLYTEKGETEMFRKGCEFVLASNDPDWNFELVQTLGGNGVDIKKHGKVIIKYGDAWLNYQYAKFRGADVLGHQKAILKANPSNIHPQLIGELAKLKGADVKAIQKRVLEMQRPDAMFPLLEINNPEVNVEQICKFYIDNRLVPYCLRAAHCATVGIDLVKRLGEVVAKYGTAEENLEFIKIRGCDFRKHEIAILNSQNAKCCAEVAFMKDSDYPAHEKVVIDSKNADLCYTLLKHPESNKKALICTIADNDDWYASTMRAVILQYGDSDWLRDPDLVASTNQYTSAGAELRHWFKGSGWYKGIAESSEKDNESEEDKKDND